MPPHRKSECTCPDPFSPTRMLYLCGTEACDRMKAFYENYINYYRPGSEEENTQQLREED